MGDVTETTRLTPQKRRELTRTTLLDAAAAVFAARGFHNASLDEIAEAAGFSKGAIYFNFGSKEDLFLALVQQREEAMIDQFFAAGAPDASDPIESVTSVFRRLAPTSTEWMLWQEFQLYALRTPKLRQNLDALGTGAFTALTAMVDQRCRELDVEPPLPIEALANLYVAVFDGIARRGALEPDSGAEELFTTIVTFIDNAVQTLGQPRKPARRAKTPRPRKVKST